MNKHSMMRAAAVVTAAASLVVLSGCSQSGGADDGTVTMTWWHNGTDDPLNGFWEEVASEFEADNPGVTIDVTAVQNEELKTKVAVALQANNAPDIFQQWGGGQMADQVAAGKLLDISDDVTDELDLIGGSAAGWQVDGKTYGLPFSLGISGFWYNKALFADAGITEPPTTLSELDADVQKLKDAGIAPIAVGAKDKWPAAHYWYWMALRDCDSEVLQQASKDLVFDDPCFEQAGDDLEAFVATAPFQEGFLGASAQQGAVSSAGLLANGKAAMELMGHWNPGVMSGLTEDGEGLGEDLGWFPFPSVEGGKGAADSALGGGDGFSCSASAPPECVDFLKYISSVDVQTRFAETGAGLPVTTGAEGGVTDPNMLALLDYRNSAGYVQLWLDIAYGNNVGGALNDAVANLFAGQGSPADIVQAMNDAAAQQ
ncbi:extracellular solute-binding protein [Agromyces atrinae]|uniref:extracellular solute-binding protein n=1 Tax=Agromyces atrinae TaxID=592376 RepID=UPI001F58BD95|nr:extracellular solute-binding protein [Agromyces atrinae]MCI2957524.1 extracellular solute-binding protein [Agromyces atrinae]